MSETRRSLASKAPMLSSTASTELSLVLVSPVDLSSQVVSKTILGIVIGTLSWPALQLSQHCYALSGWATSPMMSSRAA